MKSRTLLAAAGAVALLVTVGFGVLASTSSGQAPGGTAVFELVVDGNSVGFFQEVIGLSSSADELETLELGGRGDGAEVKITAPQRPPSVTLRRGITSNTELWAWRQQVEASGVAASRKNASIVMYDQTLVAIARWNFADAWPSKITGVQPAGGVPTEVVTIVADAVRRVNP
jgi:phage tail-like protein